MKNNNPKIFGLIGESISSSLSPAIFEYLFKRYKIDASYHLFSLDKDQLKSALEGMRVLGLGGLNVTAPFKEEVMPYLDLTDEQSEQIGAVNVICNRNGKLGGYNTDVVGIKKTLKEKLGIRRPPPVAVLIGAGGAARACLSVLQELKPGRVMIFNRTLDRARRLSEGANGRVQAYSLEDFGEYLEHAPAVLIINASSGNSKLIQENLEKALSLGSWVFELKYNLDYKIDSSNQSKYCGGLYMLVCQAVESFRIWFDIQANTDEVYRYLLRKGKESNA
jgi:shikimate dehydrogenase